MKSRINSIVMLLCTGIILLVFNYNVSFNIPSFLILLPFVAIAFIMLVIAGEDILNRLKEKDFKSIHPDTIYRTLIWALSMLNQFFAMTENGNFPFTSNEIYINASYIWSFCVSAWTLWKNTPITKKALVGEKAMHEASVNNDQETAVENDIEDADDYFDESGIGAIY